MHYKHAPARVDARLNLQMHRDTLERTAYAGTAEAPPSALLALILSKMRSAKVRCCPSCPSGACKGNNNEVIIMIAMGPCVRPSQPLLKVPSGLLPKVCKACNVCLTSEEELRSTNDMNISIHSCAAQAALWVPARSDWVAVSSSSPKPMHDHMWAGGLEYCAQQQLYGKFILSVRACIGCLCIRHTSQGSNIYILVNLRPSTNEQITTCCMRKTPIAC